MEKSAAVGRTEGCELDALELHIQIELGGQVRDFRLVHRGDGLVLQGRARTYHAKQLAQHAVMKGTALPIVANEIEVGHSLSVPPSVRTHEAIPSHRHPLAE